MKVLLFLGLLAVARAEVGAECKLDSECDEGEICIKKVFDGDTVLPEKGMCHPPMKEYEMCLMDSHCEDELMCVKSPLLDTPLPVVGMCASCAANEDCSSSEYCDHPVFNMGCTDTMMLYEKMTKKKKAMMEAGKMMMGKMMDKMGSPEGSPGRRGGPYPQFPVMAAGQRNGGMRNKRGINHWVVNGPTLRCMPRKDLNGNCKRSSECTSGVCSIEGSCQ